MAPTTSTAPGSQVVLPARWPLLADMDAGRRGPSSSLFLPHFFLGARLGPEKESQPPIPNDKTVLFPLLFEQAEEGKQRFQLKDFQGAKAPSSASTRR